MGIKRIVDVQFWNDDKVLEYFSPEDKLFMLYLMTNPHTTQLGIYAINKKHMSFELGYTIDVVNVLIDRFENKYNMVKYSNETKEIAIKNYLRYSIIKGGKPVEDCLMKEIKQVKDKSLLSYVYSNIKDCETLNDTVKKVIETINENQNDNENDNDNEVSYNDTGNDTLNKNNLNEEFETIWKEYPNKQGKAKSLKLYIKARTKDNVTYQNVQDGLERYLKYCEQNKDWYSPKNGSTWFNQQSWNDEYPIREAAKQPTRKEIVPDWMNKEVKKDPISSEEEKEMADILNKYKNDDLEKRKEALIERLKQ